MEQHTYLFRSAVREQRPLKAQSLVAVAFNPGRNAYQAQRLQFDSRLKQGEEEQMGTRTGKAGCNEDQGRVEVRVGWRGRSGPGLRKAGESGNGGERLVTRTGREEGWSNQRGLWLQMLDNSTKKRQAAQQGQPILWRQPGRWWEESDRDVHEQ